jgi:hypothetical protein
MRQLTVRGAGFLLGIDHNRMVLIVVNTVASKGIRTNKTTTVNFSSCSFLALYFQEI